MELLKNKQTYNFIKKQNICSTVFFYIKFVNSFASKYILWLSEKKYFGGSKEYTTRI